MNGTLDKNKKSVKKNFFYNLVYQLFLIIVPIIVTPYVSRVLESDGVGKYSYSSSIVSYFTLLAALGFSYYAQRAIAKYQDDKAKQSTIFWEIFIIKIVSTFFSFGVFVTLALFVPAFKDYKSILLILSINVLAVGMDVTYLFQGNEEFKKIALSNFFAKALVIVSVFVFVKSKDDLLIYTLIQACSPLISALIMLPFIRKRLVKVPLASLKPFQHFWPCMRLFIPTIAVSVYTMLDKTMIGLLVQGETTIIVDGVTITKKIADLENGYYNQAEKIIKMLVTIVTALGTVMIPRNAYYFANGEEEKAKQNVVKGLKFAFLLSLPLMLGVVAVADNFSPWFFGEGYDKVPLLMKVFSPLILCIGLSNVFGVQYLIPSGQDTKFTISVTIGAFVNLALNSFLIPFYSSVGAAIASACAEFSILLIQMIMLRKVFRPLKVLALCWKYMLSALVMFVPCLFMGIYLPSSIWNTIAIVLVGIVLYGVMLFITKDEFAFGVLNKLTSKFKQKKIHAANQKMPSDSQNEQNSGKTKGEGDGNEH